MSKEKEKPKTLAQLYEQAEQDFKGVTESNFTEGDRQQGTIFNVQEGKIQDLIPEKNLSSWKGNVTDPAIQLTINLDGTELTFKKILSFKLGSTNSKLYKYRKKYGKFPEINDIIWLEYDGKYWTLAGID